MCNNFGVNVNRYLFTIVFKIVCIVQIHLSNYLDKTFMVYVLTVNKIKDLKSLGCTATSYSCTYRVFSFYLKKRKPHTVKLILDRFVISHLHKNYFLRAIQPNNQCSQSIFKTFLLTGIKFGKLDCISFTSALS